jgi:uncharacterized SAM-binding protein YcdF (DUF218 family)
MAIARLIRAAVRALAAFGLLFLLVTVTPVTKWWAKAMAGPWNDPSGEVLIVLGGSVLDNGVLGLSSYWRSTYAVLAYREGGFREVILSGGGIDKVPIVVPMRDFIQCQGVPADVIRLETASKSTRENALFTARMLPGDLRRKVLLTSDYHMYRAHRAFVKAGLQVEPRPFPDVIKRSGRWSSRWPAFLDLATETIKIAYYYARGWI